jgi:hypothetical protein
LYIIIEAEAGGWSRRPEWVRLQQPTSPEASKKRSKNVEKSDFLAIAIKKLKGKGIEMGSQFLEKNARKNAREARSAPDRIAKGEHDGAGTFQFVDNRPATGSQKTMQAMADNSPRMQQAARFKPMTDNRVSEQPQIVQKKENQTGLPDNLKSGIESLSGIGMDDVKVHFNSSKPAQLNALAFAQGSDIHLGGGQEKHLPHEAWHVVQQKQGRVQPTMQMKGGTPVNDDVSLETEADVMGARALQQPAVAVGIGIGIGSAVPVMAPVAQQAVAQRELDGNEKTGDRIKIWENGEIVEVYLGKAWTAGDKYVTFYRKKQTNKSKDKPEKIDADRAFPLGTANKLIGGEVAQTGEANEALENSEFGPLNVPEEVVKYLIELVRENSEDYELEVSPNPTRILLMISTTETFAALFAGEDAMSLKEFKELIESDEDYYLALIMDEMAHTGVHKPTSGGEGSGGGGGSEEWKTKQTEKLKGSLLHRIEGKEHADIVSEDSTLHHKVSRSRFKRLLALLADTPSSQKGVGEMWEFIATIRSLTHAGDPETALENWVANIELGVLVNRRKPGDDPSEKFDGSFPGGIATPRTIELQEVDLIIQGATTGVQVNWHEVAGRLVQTQLHHAFMTKKEGLGPEEFTTPHLGQWGHTSEGFVRDKPSTSVKSGQSGGHEESKGEHKGESKGESKREFKGESKGESKRAPKEESKEPSLQVGRESAVPLDIADSVTDFLLIHRYNPGRPLLIVTGKNWACYIRCVLHHFGLIDRYGEVMKEVKKTNVDVSSGVVVGSPAETKIIAAITKVTTKVFHVQATDASHGHSALSAVQAGAVVRIVLTGAHFSLLQ